MASMLDDWRNILKKSAEFGGDVAYGRAQTSTMAGRREYGAALPFGQARSSEAKFNLGVGKTTTVTLSRTGMSETKTSSRTPRYLLDSPFAQPIG